MLSNPTKKRGECFRIPAKYMQIQIEHTPYFWEGVGWKSNFLVVTKFCALSNLTHAAFFLLTICNPAARVDHVFPMGFLEGLRSGGVWTPFFRTQHTQFVTHDCQKKQHMQLRSDIYQVKDVRGRYLDKPNVVGCRHQYTGTTSLLDMS